MSYRRRLLLDTQTPTPLEPLRGGQLMRRARASAVHATGDRVLSHGRRVLLQVGLHGAGEWSVADSAVDPSPDPSTERIVARLPTTRLTPGCFLRLYVVAQPSGMTTTAGPTPHGAKGLVRLAVDWDNGIDTPTTTTTIPIPGSKADYAAQPSGAGAAWASIYRRRSTLIEPADLAKVATLAAWSDGAEVSMTLSYVGAPRALDVIVVEEPYAYAANVTAGGWATPLHSNAVSQNLGELPGPWPVVRRSGSDAGHGVEVLVDSARRLSQELGPALWYASAYDEGNADVTASEASARSASGTTWTELVSDSTSAYAASSAGASVSSGANARRVQESEPAVVLRDVTNAAPVTCWVYGRLTSVGPTAAVRFQSGTEAIVEVPISAGTTWGWHSARGHLRVGLGAQDPTCLQVRAATDDAGGIFQWRYLAVVAGH